MSGLTGAELVELAAALGRHPAPDTRFGSAPPLDADLATALAQAVHASRSAVMLTDGRLDEPGPVVRYVNPAFVQLTGYTLADLAGRTPRILQGPATDRSVLDRLRQDLATTGTFEGQAINYRADGTPFVMSWRIAAVVEDDGTTSGYVAIQDDATRVWLDRLREHGTITALQQSLLPAGEAEVAGLDVATAYRPADDASRLGGDWYDIVAAPDGSAHLVVGDVTGHGLASAAHMGRFRWALAALLDMGHDPIDAIAELRRLNRGTGAFATVVVATVSPGRDRLDVVTAGHPPVVLVAADGTVDQLATDVALIGPNVPDREVVAASRPLAPGALVCLFSDGLVERRHRSFHEGVDDLSHRLATDDRRTTAPLDALAESLADEVAGADTTDDVALVLARVPA